MKIILLWLACLAAASSVAQAQMTEVVLHRFTGADGASPEAGVTRDAAGNRVGNLTSKQAALRLHIGK